MNHLDVEIPYLDAVIIDFAGSICHFDVPKHYLAMGLNDIAVVSCYYGEEFSTIILIFFCSLAGING